MFNADRFKLMKSSAYFINVGRGMVCKIDDLADAIKSGEIAGCGLDVYEIEPLPSGAQVVAVTECIDDAACGGTGCGRYSRASFPDHFGERAAVRQGRGVDECGG